MVQSRNSSDLVDPISLLETVKSIDSGTISAAESVSGCLRRIEQTEDQIHAFTTLNPNAAKQATTAKGPLAGTTFAVKDVIETADMPTEHNSPIYKGNKSPRDASIVALARKAGAVCVGKSVTTEFAFFHPGSTRNPHQLEHTPGGSSSGSAAAVASGMAHFAIGTQTGGSVIRPAAFCGVTGYKPSAGLLPKVGVKDFSWSLDTVGLFAKSVQDIAFLASHLSSRHLSIKTGSNFKSPILGVVRGHNWSEADPKYRSAFEDLLTSLKRFGLELIDIAPSEKYIAAFHAHQIIQDFEARQALAWEYQNHNDLLSPLLRQTLDFAQTINASDYDEARVAAEIASAEIDDHFEDVDAFISLSAPGPAPHGLDSTGSSIFNRIWTLFGLPSINITGLMSDKGLPLGIQLIGPYMSDAATLQCAHWLEGAIERHLNS